jgi:DNA polymerase-3 subunit delta'
MNNLPHPYPWQETVWKLLLSRVRNERLPHALLFSGPTGLGKRELALSFAARLLCDTPQENDMFCGKCRGCTLFLAGNHPDFLHISPEEEGKELTVGQIRGVAAYQALTPQYATHKVVVITPAERMNANASNALLKTLEEPTPGTLLLLVTDRPAGLLPTIRSRCQAVTFSIPENSPELLTWIQAQVDCSPEKALRLLQLANGAPLRARALAEGGEEIRQEILGSLEGLARGQAAFSQVASRWVEIGPDKVLSWVYGVICELVRIKSTGCVDSLNPSEQMRFQALTKSIDLKGLFRFLDRVQDATRLLRSHANAQLLVEELLVHWITLVSTTANHKSRPRIA